MDVSPHASEGIVLQPRKGWLALLLSVLAIGVGHFYAGRGRRGTCLLFLALSYVPIIYGLALVPPSPLVIYALFALPLIGIGVALFTMIDAVRSARRAERPYRARPYNNVLLYVGVVIASSLWSLMGITVLREHAFKAYYLPTSSMEPTLLRGDRVITNQTRREDVRRGDLITFRAPDDPRRTHIKRVIGLPGETIRLDEQGQVWVDDQPITYTAAPDAAESGLHEERFGDRTWQVYSWPLKRGTQPIEVPAAHVYVLGDNRPNSQDSRSYGPVPLGDVTGIAEHVFSRAEGLRVWSPGRR